MSGPLLASCQAGQGEEVLRLLKDNVNPNAWGQVNIYVLSIPAAMTYSDSKASFRSVGRPRFMRLLDTDIYTSSKCWSSGAQKLTWRPGCGA